MKPLLVNTIKIDDIEMYYEIYAKEDRANTFAEVFKDGKFVERYDNVLVMLHGNGECTKIFSPNVEALCNEDFVILIDSRGHGKTTVGCEEFTIDLMAEDLSKFLDELNVGKFKLLGFSDGGNIALTYAVRHPERLSHLIVAGANLDPKGLKFTTRMRDRLKFISVRANKDKSASHNLQYQLLNIMVNYPKISSRLLKNIECKVLVIEGKRDVIKPSHTRLIASSIRNSKCVTVPNSGHNVFWDNPEFVNDLISDFIS